MMKHHPTLRSLVLTTCVALILLLAPLQASAASIWDPEDARGPFDLRWIGAVFTSAGEIRLTVSFYEGFDPASLPREPDQRESHVHVWLNRAVDGWFLRRPAGKIVFFWGDFGSDCCFTESVTRLSPDVVRVVFDPLVFPYWNESTSYELRGQSSWHGGGGRSPDWTRWVSLERPW
jgi:hypothetical protein